MLARRELTVAGVRARLTDQGFPPAEIEDALARLLEHGALDDGRVARAYVRTALAVKGRGRLRIQRELHDLGVDREVAAQALAEAFADVDERALITQAIGKKMRGRPRLADPGEYARLYQHLMRQGFSPAGVAAALRQLRPGARIEEE